ncbi:S8 family serine peptidase [Streptomyces sp. NBC_00988]|uniref:S8 family serine peptidase n=1 Tax=Streptomyces sp. NBC_00988 TaxID=2903704 RepID=UPI0038670268|nr:S8 family serine peptidase [Streptomyces sp. NBC_00988]
MTQPQDFRLMIGEEPFDPIEVPTAAEGLAATRKPTIVQFAAPLNGPDGDRLKAAYGVKLDRFIPNLAFIERLDDATVARIRADFLVRSVIALDPALKLASWLPSTGTPLDLIATLFADADLTAVGAALSALGARDVVLTDGRTLGSEQYASFALDRAALPQVAAIDEVVFVEPEPERDVTDVPSAEVFQSGRTGGPADDTIWRPGLHGEGQILGLIDKGHLDLNHCFFNDPNESKANEDHRKVLGMFDQNDVGAHDHFMFVAGIAVGDQRKPSADGKTSTSTLHANRGGAYEARIVCNSMFDLFSPIKRKYVELLDRGKKAGAFIHSNSWSALVTTYNADAVDADSFSFKNEEHLIIAAASNTNDRGAGNGAPGIAKNVLCVAAAQAFPDHMTFGSGKNGPTTDGRRKPDLMAVGNGIQSALLNPRTPPSVYCDTGLPKKDPTLAATSWATPNAAAAATLVRQYFTEGWYPNGKKETDHRFNPSGALIKAVLLNSTVNMTGIAGYPSNTEGWGLIQLDRTLFFQKDPPSSRRLFVADVRHSVGLLPQTSATFRYVVGTTKDEQLKITLVWTDIPAFEGSTQTWRNVIRLEVEDALGVKYLGNDIDPATGVSNEGGTGPQDFVNNVQMVIVDKPAPGPWKITLRGSFVFEKQGYALVVSGG